MKYLILLILSIPLHASAGLPPTTSKLNGDANSVTTFFYEFPNFTGTHTGVTTSLGLLNLTGGGSNKALTASAGSVLYTDADSFELTAVGSANQVLISNGTAAPSWSSVSTLLDTTYFKQGGNSFSAAARLGTNDSNVLEFETNNALVGTFSTAGKFAIGNASPNTSAKLDVQGTDGAILYPRLSTTNRNALTPTAGMQIYNTTTTQFECYVISWLPCDAGTEPQFSDLTLTASDTLAISITAQKQAWLVEGNSIAITMNPVPFGATDPVDGAEIDLIGNGNDKTVTFITNDAANGLIGYGFTLTKGKIVTVKYKSSLDRWLVKSSSQ